MYGFPGDHPLQLQKKMCRSWLIQRLQKPYKAVGEKAEMLNKVGEAFAFGSGLVNGGFRKEAMELVRPIMSFDYMGSTEFEWGAVPRVFEFLTKQAALNHIVYGHFPLGDENYYYICPFEYQEEVRKRIEGLRADEHLFRLKEHCGLNAYFTSKNEWAKRNIGWIELDNGFMFFVDKEMFDETSKLIKTFGEAVSAEIAAEAAKKESKDASS